MKTKTIASVLFVVAAVWVSWTLGSRHGQRIVDKKDQELMKEIHVRLNSSSVTVLPATCEVGDFVFNLTEKKFYLCVSPGKWVYPNYTRLAKEHEHGEPR